MINWFHRLFNPHCKHCEEIDIQKREDLLESKVCRSCETLQRQIELANHTNKILIDKITRIPEAEQTQDTSNLRPITPRFVPWRIRQQTLEAESKKAAEILRTREAEIKETKEEMKLKVPPQAETVVEGIDELEEELGIVEKEREAQVGKNAG